ncbi:MAG TPA: DUF5667 domain-containing protein [Nocardioidaceae bacterium]|nr:DUF5667 domain-containing protein [Nocardioidaceae bacterium]
MAELLPSRRRAESFSRALEGHLQPTDQRLQRLLDTASQLSAVPLVEPRDEFRAALRERLLEAAAVELPAQAAAAATAPEPDRSRRAHAAPVTDTPSAARRRRQLVAVATGLVLVGGGTGVAAASEQALPGDMLYPVKRTLESAQVSLAQSPGGEGHALLERASTRLYEADSLGSEEELSQTRVDAVESALSDFARDASHGGSKLLDAHSTSGDAQDIRQLRAFTSQSHDTLSDLAQTLPPESQPSLMAAAETVVGLDDMARRACPDCASRLPPLTLPTTPVGLPDVGDGAPAAEPPLGLADGAPTARPGGLDDTRDRVGRLTGRNSSSPGPPATTPAPHDATPLLPDLDLGGDETPTDDGQSSSPDGDGDGAQQEQPRLDLRDLLNPAPQPSRAPRTTDAPRLDEHLREPLSDPLGPLLDGTGGVLGGLL